MPTLTTIAQISAALTTALVAGLFYAYSCSVNPGLGRLPDATYLAAMQSINRAISQAEMNQTRARFEQPWNSLHTIRTVASILAQVLVSVALLQPVLIGNSE